MATERSTTLAEGTRLGPYELVAPLGAGGMGEVYEARDTRLRRTVAVKVLPSDLASDPDRRKRFEREARAVAALSHPNISTIFDFGREETPSGPIDYLVMELLEGETLAERLRRGALPIEPLLRAGIEIASALSRAHRAGVVHRDVKPGNIVLTKTGAKLLDFGVARLRQATSSTESEGAPISEPSTRGDSLTDDGQPVGTYPYMAPEQLEGKPVDARADLFALGAVLYEMATGRRAFDGESPARVTAAILTSQPPLLTSLRPAAPPALERLVEQLLVKDPDGRMESAHDVALRLRSIAEGLDDSAGLDAPSARRKRRARLTAASLVALLMVALPTLVYLAAKQRWQHPIPSYQRVTFRRGVIWGSRFAPDGQSIYYGATWDGQPIRLYSTRLGSPESSPLSFPDADLLALSSLGELAVSLRRYQWTFPGWSHGTLARVHMAGGAPREILENVLSADWSPDGKELAVVARQKQRARLEFPIGRVLRESDYELRWPRVSPQGDVVAFTEVEPGAGGFETRTVSLVDRTGRAQVLTKGWRWLNGLAWSPGGDEVWFAATKDGPHHSLWAVTRSGQVRLLVPFPGFATVQDVSSDGRALVTLGGGGGGGWGAVGFVPGDSTGRSLSWLDRSTALAITPDGRMIMGTESGEGLKDKRAVYVRATDGSSEAVRLGDGFGLALSPDAKWVLSRPEHNTRELVLLPTGPGEPRTLPNEGLEYAPQQRALPNAWAAGGSRILVAARQAADRPFRSFVMDLEGRATAVTPEGCAADAISPDGQRVAELEPDGRILLYPVGGGAPQVAPGPPEKGEIATWSLDGRSLFVGETHGVEMHIFRRDLATGRRERVKDLAIADPAGILWAHPWVSADGRTFGYNYARGPSSLYLIGGVK